MKFLSITKFKTRIYKVNKRILYFLFSFLVVSSFSVSAQEVSDPNVSIKVKEATLLEIFNNLEEQTNFKFAYSDDISKDNQTYELSFSNEKLSEVLSELSKKAGFEYNIAKNKVSVRRLEKRNVSGKLTDSNTGEALIGATIRINGSPYGAVTDVNGNYSMEVFPNSVLNFSYVGYETVETAINNQSVINLSLVPSATDLEEVVVVGYGVQKKVNLTGSVDQVTSKVFENRSFANATQALQGVIPNLNIVLSDGKPIRSADYNIRGTTSIGQGGSALVLIDGVEGNPALLNPNDIESVSVLKDAASAAIYGARGSFGVVLITTKEPQVNKTTIKYSGNFSSLKPTAVPDYVTDGYTYAERFREAYYAWNNYSSLPSKMNKSQKYSDEWLQTFKERKEQGITDEVVIEDDGTYTYYGNTDWYDLLYKDITYSQDHNLMVSGGTEKSDFYISTRLYDYDGLFAYNTDDYKMVNLRGKGSLQVTDWLKITNNLEFSNMKYHNPLNVGEGGSVWRNIADEGHPSATVFNPDGTLTMSSAYTVGDFIYGKNGIDYQEKVLRNTTGFTANFFNNKLRVNGDFTFRNHDNNDTRKRIELPYSTAEGTTSYLGTSYNDLREQIRNTLYTATNIYAEYENTFAEANYFKGMVGYNYETSEYDLTSVLRNGLLLEDAENINLALGESIETSSDYEKWRILGTFFRVNYGYKDRYLIEVNGRYDGSSKFPDDQQYAFFPSVSAGWRVSEEPFWSLNNNIISDLKFRASYGSLGNGTIDPYSYLELFSIETSGRVLNGALNKYTSSPDPIPESLTWETATTSDYGIDFGMLNNKFRFTGDYYIRKTTDMYTAGATLPDVFGAESPYGNYADLTTKGWEISLSWRDQFLLANKPFNYSVQATLHDYTSVVDRFNNSTKSLGDYDYYEGMKIGEIWGYKTDGLFQSQTDIDSYVNTIIKTSSNGTTYLGDLKFVDLNENGKIDYGSNTADDPGDKTIIGNSEPRYIYSLSLNGDWNGFFVSTFFQGVGKQDWWPGSESAFWGQYNRPYNNLPTWHLDNYWTEDNPDGYLPRYAGYNPSLRSNSTDRYLQNIAYIRLKNLQVGYSIPVKLLSKVRMQEASIYVTGENLWCWSPLYKRTKDFDVTNTSGSDPDLTSGTSGKNYSYPLMKSVTVGISLTF